MKSADTEDFVLYLAVVPHYRQACVDELYRRLGRALTIYAGRQHMDDTVTTRIRADQYTTLTNRFFLHRRLMMQTGHWRHVLRADTAILDLNPRCLSVWILTSIRLLMRRRTLHWGHLHPRGGPTAGTAGLRRALRRISDGTVLYGYEQAKQASTELPTKPTWVAANALYAAGQLGNFADQSADRNSVIYVGRLVVQKKVHVLIEAFAQTSARRDGARLSIVGEGDQAQSLNDLVRSLDLESKVDLAGSVTDPDDLARLYAQSFVSVSPGYVGLNLTQSLGFGVPQLASRDEQHSPEIELAKYGYVTFFDTDSAQDLSAKLDQAWACRDSVDPAVVAAPVIRHYTSEAMADGIVRALKNQPSASQLEGTPQVSSATSSRSRIPNVLAKPIRQVLNRLAISGKVDVGDHFRAGLGASISSQHGLSIGRFASIGRQSTIDVDGTIGNFFLAGTGVMIVGRDDHAFDEIGIPVSLSTWIGDRQPGRRDTVQIGDDVWIGAGSTILSGVTIGSGVIIAAGSVVTRDVPPCTITAGNPASPVRQRFKTPEQMVRHLDTIQALTSRSSVAAKPFTK